jgi:hypothetical protein
MPHGVGISRIYNYPGDGINGITAVLRKGEDEDARMPLVGRLQQPSEGRSSTKMDTRVIERPQTASEHLWWRRPFG